MPIGREHASLRKSVLFSHFRFATSITDTTLSIRQPIEAYCPNGPGDEKVLFLQKDAFEGEQYSPVSSYNNDDTGVGNDWVMVGTKDGDPKSTCSQYEDLNDGKSPLWAADGSRTELKEHVLCCLEQDDLKKEQDISRGMNPIWLDDKHGWNGGSYNDAVEFCQGVGGKRLCPYAACEYECVREPAVSMFGCSHSVPLLVWLRLSARPGHEPNGRPRSRFQPPRSAMGSRIRQGQRVGHDWEKIRQLCHHLLHPRSAGGSLTRMGVV